MTKNYKRKTQLNKESLSISTTLITKTTREVNCL